MNNVRGGQYSLVNNVRGDIIHGGTLFTPTTDFSRTVGTAAIKLTGMTVSPVSNRRQTNSNCSVRQTRSLFLPTQAYNRSHFYMVRLVWFPGYMDWERRKYTWEIRGKRGRSRSEVICTACTMFRVKRVNLHLRNDVRLHGRPVTKIPVQLTTCGARSGSPQLKV